MSEIDKPKTRIIVSRRQKQNIVMILNGFILPEVPYIVKDVNLNGMDAVVIYRTTTMLCEICGEEFEGDFYSNTCDTCHEKMNECPEEI